MYVFKYIPGLFEDFKEETGAKQREFDILKRVLVSVQVLLLWICFSVGGNEYTLRMQISAADKAGSHYTTLHYTTERQGGSLIVELRK